MERKPEPVKVHHVLDFTSGIQVRVQQFFLLVRHRSGKQFQIFTFDTRRSDKGGILPMDFLTGQVVKHF